MTTICSLAGLCPGQQARIAASHSDGAMRRRLYELGLIAGTQVTCLCRAPAGDPAAYLVRGSVIALRRQDASGIMAEVAD